MSGETETDIGAIGAQLPWEKLQSRLIKEDLQGPSDGGQVCALVQRPATNARKVVDHAELTIDGGMEGSGWVETKYGHRDQICTMSSEAIRAISDTEDPDAWALAGDQLFVDLNLSKDNLKPGDRVIVGDSSTGVILEVSALPHLGCAKFSKRFGPDALKVVNCPQGKQRRLRGIYFEVVRGGVISVGDPIQKYALGKE